MESLKSVAERIRSGKVKVGPAFIDDAAKRGIVLFCFKGEGIYNKSDFFYAAKKVMKLPDYFGNNWDAFDECINDLSWVPSKNYIFIYDNTSLFFSGHKEDEEILSDILNDARENWRDEGISFESILSDKTIIN